MDGVHTHTHTHHTDTHKCTYTKARDIQIQVHTHKCTYTKKPDTSTHTHTHTHNQKQAVGGHQNSSSPDIHEPYPPNVGRISMIQHSRELLPRQLEGEQLEKQAKCRGHNPSSRHPTNLHVRVTRKKQADSKIGEYCYVLCTENQLPIT